MTSNMKMGTVIIAIGIIMFISGLVMFYSVEIGQKDQLLRFIKNTGTFIGLSGMGVTLAGILLSLINRNEPIIKKSFDV
jgi:hypothetical protein